MKNDYDIEVKSHRNDYVTNNQSSPLHIAGHHDIMYWPRRKRFPISPSAASRNVVLLHTLNDDAHLSDSKEDNAILVVVHNLHRFFICM